MPTVVDNFDRADGPLGSSWDNAGGLDFEIESNLVRRSGTGTSWSAVRHTTPLGSADHEVQVQINELIVSTWAGAAVRMHATNSTGYICILTLDGEIRFYKWNGGLDGVIGTATTIALPTVPFTLAVRAVGNELFCFINGTLRASVIDENSTYTTEQHCGVVTSTSLNKFDNYSATDLSENIDIGLAPFTTFQRNLATNLGILTFQASWFGTPTAIEARWNSGAWITVDDTPANGNSSCELIDLTPGEGALEVRFANDHAVSRSVDNILVGDVFLVAGQSNAEGRANWPQSYSHPTLRASMYNDAGWQELNDPTHTGGSSTGSVWPLVATDLLASQNVPVAFICTATGGTALHNGTWLPPSGIEYQNAVSAFDNSNTNAIAAILWHQGEADASAGASQTEHRAALNELSSHFASDITFIDSPKVLVCQLGQRTAAGDTDLDAIRLAQADTWNTNEIIFPGPVLWHYVPLGDGVHFSSLAEITELRNLWREAINASVYGTGFSRGPQIFGIEGSGDSLTLTFDKDLVDPGTSYDSDIFSVQDGGTPISVTNADRSTNRTVVLSLQTAPTGPVTVSMGSGSLAGIASLPVIPRSTGTFPLPAEPFIGLATAQPQTTAFRLIDAGVIVS